VSWHIRLMAFEEVLSRCAQKLEFASRYVYEWHISRLAKPTKASREVRWSFRHFKAVSASINSRLEDGKANMI